MGSTGLTTNICILRPDHFGIRGSRVGNSSARTSTLKCWDSRVRRDAVKKNEPRILIYDIENSPLLGYAWELYETNIIEVVEHSYLLSIAWKWLGEKEVHCIALPDFKGYRSNPHDDEKLVSAFHEVMEQADFLVGHNADNFDYKKLNARFLVHGLPPVRPTKMVDTLKVARRVAKFPSNKLDQLGSILGIGRKLPHTGKHLWLACMNGDLKSWRIMKEYNKEDVRLDERLFIKLRPFISSLNVNIHTRKLQACPRCGSIELWKRGMAYTATSEAQRYQCKQCFGWSQGKPEKLASKITIK